jgi:hypothetical protein
MRGARAARRNDCKRGGWSIKNAAKRMTDWRLDCSASKMTNGDVRAAALLFICSSAKYYPHYFYCPSKQYLTPTIKFLKKSSDIVSTRIIVPF